MKILLSIKPEYAEKILAGSKRFEFRRRVPKNPNVKSVVIYATLPIGRVVGEFTIKKIHSDQPEELWAKTHLYSGVTEEFFNSYFDGKDLGYAIEILVVRKFKQTQPLETYISSGIAPQSYVYLRE